MNLLVILILVSLIISMLYTLYGSVVLWEKSSYLGDGLIHASTLGIAIASATKFNHYISIIGVLCCFFLLMYLIPGENNKKIGILSAGFTSLALIIARENVLDILLGDILLISEEEIFVMFLFTLISYLWFFLKRKSIILYLLNEDIAQLSGVNILSLKIQKMILLSFLIAISIEFTGTLLCTSLLLLPASIGLLKARSINETIFLGNICCLISSAIAIAASFFLNLPYTPTLVFTLFLFFMIGVLFKKI